MSTATPSTASPSTASQSTAPRWLDRDEMRAWIGYVETQGDLLTALENDLAPTGLTLGDYQVFVYLSSSEDDSMKMCDLAEILQLSPSGLTRRLDGLVKAGWVERRPSDVDRRVMHAVLTDAGRAKLETAAPIHVESVRARIIDHLDRDDLQAFTRAFGKIRAALDAERAAKIAS
jgi:DNA-binding MarR family transcriptional regulator